MIAASGYLKMIDFGFAKTIPYKSGDKVLLSSYTICGTPEYLAPELIQSKGHDKSVDYWALGCLIYELICGRTPFAHESQRELFQNILMSRKTLKFPSRFNSNAKDLVQQLLKQEPTFRLGNTKDGVEQIMKHKWFTTFNTNFWPQLNNMELDAPYIPAIRNALDTSNFDPYPEDNHVSTYRGNQDIFANF